MARHFATFLLGTFVIGFSSGLALGTIQFSQNQSDLLAILVVLTGFVLVSLPDSEPNASEHRHEEPKEYAKDADCDVFVSCPRTLGSVGGETQKKQESRDSQYTISPEREPSQSLPYYTLCPIKVLYRVYPTNPRNNTSLEREGMTNDDGEGIVQGFSQIHLTGSGAGTSRSVWPRPVSFHCWAGSLRVVLRQVGRQSVAGPSRGHFVVGR